MGGIMEFADSDRYLILSLDGGGIRGVLQARILERLERASPFLHKVQLIAGSSIGGINALCLAADRSPLEMVGLFREGAEEIFSSRDWWDVIAGPTDEVFRANYRNKGLKKRLESLLGDKTLGDLTKKVTITSFDLDNQDAQSESAATAHAHRSWKVKIFHNFSSAGNDSDQLAVDIGLRTSAAPTYFPSHQGYVDGGLVANNPSLCAVARAVKSGVSLDRIVVLSVGTGQSPIYIPGDQLDWGFKQWAPYLMPLFIDGMVGLPDYICRQLLSDRYARIHPFLPEDVPIDAIDRLDDLLDWADDVDLSTAADLLLGLPE